MVKMGVAQKTMFSISDRLAKFFGISEAPMEHNAIVKSKQTFFLQIRHERPWTKGEFTLALIIMMVTLHCAHKKPVYYVALQFARVLNVEIL